MKIIGTVEEADKLITAIKQIVPYINDLTKQMKRRTDLFLETQLCGEGQQIAELLDKVERMLYEALDDVSCLCKIIVDYRNILAEHANAGDELLSIQKLPINHMKPYGKHPRDLAVSSYGFHQNDSGMQVYDSPEEVSQYLYTTQGKANHRFKGTCGLCSCANILRLAGADYGEGEMINYASTHYDSAGNRLCDADSLLPGGNGGTTPKARKKILEHFGISSSVFAVNMEHGIASEETMEQIGRYVSEGRGVILSVFSGEFNPAKYRWNNGPHAVTVVSVTKDGNGKIRGYHICDSNYKTEYYDVERIRRSLTGNDMNVTTQIIR